MKIELEIGTNLRDVLKDMIKRAPEEIGNITRPWATAFDRFLASEKIQGLELNKQESEGGTCIDIRIRKI